MNKNGHTISPEDVEWAEVVKALRAKTQLGRGRFGDLLGVTAMTVRRWELDTVQPSEQAQALLSQLGYQVDPEPMNAALKTLVSLAGVFFQMVPAIVRLRLEQRLAEERASAQKKQPHYNVLPPGNSTLPAWFHTLAEYHAKRQWQVLLDFHEHFDLDLLPPYEQAKLACWVGTAQLRLGANDKAEIYFKEGLKDRTVKPVALGNLAAVELSRRNLGKAKHYLLEALELSPGSLVPLYNLLALASIAENEQECKEHYANLVECHPQFATEAQLDTLGEDPDMSYFKQTSTFKEAMKKPTQLNEDNMSPLQLMRHST